MFRFRILVLLACLALATLVAPPPLARMQDPAAPPGTPSAALEAGPSIPDQPVVIRLAFQTQDQVNALAGWLDIWAVDHTAGVLTAYATPEQFRALLDMGYAPAVDARRTADLLVPPGYPCYRTVEEMHADMAQLAADHPNLVELIDYGDSWEKITPGGQPGYDLLALKITNQAIPSPKPAFFLDAAHHAREMATPESAMDFATWLVAHYGLDADATWIVDYQETYVVPIINPDGRKHAETGDWWRKNTDNDDGCSDPSSWGTDLNRNYNFKWGCCSGSSGWPCDEIYRGPAGSSEPEVYFYQDLVRSVIPDQRGPGDGDPAPLDTTGVLNSLHAYGNLDMWAWGWTATPSPNGADLTLMGEKLGSINGYEACAIGAPGCIYVVDGDTVDWAYGERGIAAFTFEIGEQFFQPCADLQGIIEENRPAYEYQAKLARSPYASIRGPDASNLAASPGGVPVGDPIVVSATLDEGYHGGQSVAGGEVYVDVPPWAGGVAIPLQASDGSFDSPVEPADATLDTSGWSSGQHIVFARGQDAAGNWGVVSALFVYVLTGSEGTLEGTVTDSLSGDPLAATVTVQPTGWSVDTDPATGTYSLALPQGAYDATATASGHGAQTATGLMVQDGQVTVQDFALEPLPCILLVDDDDDSPDVRSYYEDALVALGTDYDVWEVASQGSPSPAGLMGYQMVIWFSGDIYSGPSAADEASLAAYLDAGGRVFISSQDYHYASGLTPFMQTYLGVLSVDDDVSYTSVTGVAGDAIGDGLGTLTLTYPGSNWSDYVTPNASAQAAFTAPAGQGAGIHKDGGAYRSVFFGFPWEALPAVERVEVLDRIIDWFGGCQEPLPSVFIGNIKTKYRVIEPGPPTVYKVLGRAPVFNEALQPVVDATVTAQWELPGGQIKVKTATTRPNGSAYYKQASPQEGLYVITVLDVQAAGYVYDPAQNYETGEELPVP